jgi:hypothetical protein
MTGTSWRDGRTEAHVDDALIVYQPEFDVADQARLLTELALQPW